MSDEAALQQQKRLLIPYLDRANELENVQPKIAYYCKLHALEQVIPLGPSLHPAIKAFLTPLMAELAKVKPTLELDRASDAKLCEAFARRVFATADAMDRSGRADAVTKRTFVYADQYFKVVSQFGPLPPAALKLQKYAQWRAVEIAKALREGRTPEPPPALDTATSPDEEDELMAMLNSMPGAPSNSDAAPAPSAAAVPPPPTQQPAAYAQPPAPPSSAAAAAPDKPPPRHFHPGQSVLYCADSNAHATKREGTVQQAVVASSGEMVYKVALADGSGVTATGDKLAPALGAGAAVLFYPPEGGPAEEAEVEEAYSSRWPPTYLVKRRGRGLVETEDDRLVAALPPAAPPAEEAAPPPPPPLQGLATGEGEPAAAAGTSPGQPPSAEGAFRAGEAAGHADHAATGAIGAGAAQRAASDELSAIAEEMSEASTLAATGGAAAFATPAPPPEQQAHAPPSAAAFPAPFVAAAVFPAAPAPSLASAPLPPSPPPPRQQPAAFYPPAPAAAYAAAAPAQPRPQPRSHPVPQAEAEPAYTDDLGAIMEAQKLTKTAGSAISFEDLPTAVRYLNQALSLLTRGSQGKGK